MTKRVLVTGATGYVGGRLVPRLLENGYTVRTLVRDPARVSGRSWESQVEVIQGDVFEPASLQPALAGVHSAYYLIHSMSDSADFHQRDLSAARHFGEAARQAGVERIIYLGGLGDPESELSAHLRSRHETGEVLRASGVPVLEFRAAIIVGSGSVSFEMIRYLTERVPVMICPQWVYTRIQPIAIRDVLSYLVSALELDSHDSEIIEIGGRDVLSYGDMMLGYARARGLRRALIPVPVLTPHLSSYWAHWVTPIPARIARPLIQGLRNEVVVRDERAAQRFPSIKPMDYATAVQRALERLKAAQVETSWSDALVSSQGDGVPVSLETREGMILERRQARVAAPATEVYQTFARLGGTTGWLYGDWAWKLRGVMDRLIGGVGFRRGRRDPNEVRVGDAIDFWRVEAVRPGQLLRLRAEMKVPGLAWLQFEVQNLSDGQSLLTQTAFFAPKGLSGLIYWYLLYPAHTLIFAGLFREIGARARKLPDQVLV